MRAYQAVLLVTLASLARCSMGQAFRVGVVKPHPRATGGDTLTVSASPSTVNFTLVAKGTATGSAPVVITSSFSGLSLIASFNLYGYFVSSTSALSGGSPVVNIPSSCVLGQVPTGSPTTFTAFTSTGPYGGASASLQLFTQFGLIALSGSRTDTLNLEINLSSLPQLPAGTYTGTLILEIQAF